MTGEVIVRDVTGTAMAGTQALDGRVVIRLSGRKWWGHSVELTPAAAREHAGQVLATAAGIQGRRVLALATGSLAADIAADVEACFAKAPGLDAMTDADWAHVDYVLRALPGSWPLLRGLWEQAGEELSRG